MKLTEITQESKEEAEQRIKETCNSWGIKGYTINDDLTLDVEGNVHLNHFNIRKFPVKFRHVTGDFLCGDNRLLDTLEGAPTHVDGIFSCARTQIESFEFAPVYVGEGFNCWGLEFLNKLGYLKEVNGVLNCERTKITNMLYVFKIKNLTGINSGNLTIDNIVNKYLTSTRDIMDCQSELIDAGFREIAKLK